MTRTPTCPPLMIVPQHFGSLVFDRRNSRYLPFDHEATRLLRLLSTRPAGSVISALPGDERSAAIDFFEFFEQRGFFDIAGRLAGRWLDVQVPEDHLVGPLAVHLEVIGACNLTCTHCFAGELPRNQNPLSLEEMTSLFDELAGMGSYRLGLTGGEPLLRKDLFDIIDAAGDAGLHPCLTTNGLLITDKIARQFGRRELVWLNVSLDGATAASNDAVRGHGTFAAVLEKLQLLREHARFTLAFTITRANADEIEQCAEIARRVGAHTAVFRPTYPTGIALRHPELMPTFEQYHAALQRLGAVVMEDEDLGSLDPFSPQHREAGQARIVAGSGCGAANHVASISVQGAVNPCSFLGPGWNAGNIREQSFRNIWHRSAAFTGMRAMSNAGCRGCDDDSGSGTFSGGCRARSLAAYGDVNAPDPWQTEYERLHGPAVSPLAIVELEHG